MTETAAGIGDEAVGSATGHDWEHWLDVLDDRSALELTHKEIVAELGDAGVESAWWRQTIANAYEVERGMREVGETADAGFQVGVQRTLPVANDALWEFLCSAEGRRLWLGGGTSFEPEPGTTYEADDGTVGEVRTVKAGERLRNDVAARGPRRTDHATANAVQSRRRRGEDQAPGPPREAGEPGRAEGHACPLAIRARPNRSGALFGHRVNTLAVGEA